jgi:hypothetical protein
VTEAFDDVLEAGLPMEIDMDSFYLSQLANLPEKEQIKNNIARYANCEEQKYKVFHDILMAFALSIRGA